MKLCVQITVIANWCAGSVRAIMSERLEAIQRACQNAFEH
jgi:hypothetical protein